MEHLDIHKIMKYYALDKEVIAKLLFPGVKHPIESLRRVLNGVSVLDVNQVALLANYLGVLVSDLYSLSNNWKGKTEEGYLVFIKGPYKIKLGYKGIFITVYKDNELIDSHVNSYTHRTIPEFINYINNLIESYECN